MSLTPPEFTFLFYIIIQYLIEANHFLSFFSIQYVCAPVIFIFVSENKKKKNPNGRKWLYHSNQQIQKNSKFRQSIMNRNNFLFCLFVVATIDFKFTRRFFSRKIPQMKKIDFFSFF